MVDSIIVKETSISDGRRVVFLTEQCDMISHLAHHFVYAVVGVQIKKLFLPGLPSARDLAPKPVQHN